MVAKNQAPSVDALCSSKVSLPAMISLRAMSVSEVRGAGLDHWPMPQTKLAHAL